jgi:hypothetical protein
VLSTTGDSGQIVSWEGVFLKSSPNRLALQSFLFTTLQKCMWGSTTSALVCMNVSYYRAHLCRGPREDALRCGHLLSRPLRYYVHLCSFLRRTITRILGRWYLELLWSRNQAYSGASLSEAQKNLGWLCSICASEFVIVALSRRVCVPLGLIMKVKICEYQNRNRIIELKGRQGRKCIDIMNILPSFVLVGRDPGSSSYFMIWSLKGLRSSISVTVRRTRTVWMRSGSFSWIGLSFQVSVTLDTHN